MILADREGYWIEHHKLWDRQHGYNLNRFVGGRTIASEETRQILKDRWTEIKSKDNYKIGFIEHKLTEDMKKDINELRACGLTRQEIFDQIGISRTQFYRAMEGDGQYGGNKKNRTSYKTMTPEIKRRAIELREQGRSWREIGEELGVDRVTFYKHKMVAGHRDMVRKSMTEEAKQEVLRLRREGKTWRAISEATGFSKNTFFNNKLHII